MFGLGTTEIVIILVVVLFVFGPSKLPQLGKGIGEAISGFKNALTPDEKADKIEKS
jgi:sec-independent protein translocase protein TatA